MDLAEKKRGVTFVVQGNGLKRKCDQVEEEMKTIQQDFLSLEAKKNEVALKIDIKSSLLKTLVLFCLPFSK